MDYKEAKEDLKKELAVLEKLNDAGLMEMVSHISVDNIFLIDDIDVDSTRRQINKAFECTSDKLSTYYISYCGKYLVTGYKNDMVSSFYQSSNVRALLEKVSKGKCKIVETVEPEKTVKTVVCEMEEES